MWMQVRNVDEALVLGLGPFLDRQVDDLYKSAPRGRETLEYCYPWVTTYLKPMERVSQCRLRDANPFFHFFEAMWILAGRDDVAFLAHILPKFAQYSDNGRTLHGSYGRRLGEKLPKIIQMLKDDPDTRRAQCAIWLDRLDLGHQSNDIPCNGMLTFRIRDGKLDLTVYNRSNDLVWGAYGANAVQFSFILEYVAEQVGVPMGVYNQVSSCMHVYTDERYYNARKGGEAVLDVDIQRYAAGVITPRPMLSQNVSWLKDLQTFFANFDYNWDRPYEHSWFTQVVGPMWMIFKAYKQGGASKGLAEAAAVEIGASDWARAVHDWLMRRAK